MSKPKSVVVHPLVLLSVVDHFNRLNGESRVVGVLLGSVTKNVVDVTNSFAVPFDEDSKDSSIWFFDHNFLERMMAMFKKVNAREKIVGWYSTGPKIKPSDININEIFRKYVPHPAYVIIDVKPKEIGIPTKAFYAIEEAKDEKSQPELTFSHLPCEIGALEAEEIGVEHLLRDVKDTTVTDLTTSVKTRISSLKALKSRLGEIKKYLSLVSKKELPINHNVLYLLQDIFNLLPGLQLEDNKSSFITQTNDSMLTMYISSMIRSIISLHDLINNKRDLRDLENKKINVEKKSKEKIEDKKEKKESSDKKK